MRNFIINELTQQLKSYPAIPSICKKELEEIIEKLYQQLFPSYEVFNSRKTEADLYHIYDTLISNVSHVITKDEAQLLIAEFFSKLPNIQKELYDDALTYLKVDPAAKMLEEVILTYPGFFATSIYRMAHALFMLKIPIIPHIFTEYAHFRTGIDIHPGAAIGSNFFLKHGTGTVISETCKIGNNVKIYQGVTLGGSHNSKNIVDIVRHLTIEDDVTICAGATIVGGKTIIGAHSVIGGNVYLSESIPPFSKVYCNTEKEYVLEKVS